ncbi:GMP synthase [Cnuibacter physcomitrellae]|uniref:Uncharacterized protein n=1 Tax=Cnuibacter physcomitrellae TaxID=1619308 RepID=A0A1X9LMN8_9MICO|nr:hypothetical protein [Cnuibacter physcomitrellae]ARJ04379.1 hypothetical protein B5808_03405 [Cnuibacter physcomitrellae]GGI40906.1 GMP synthase [Cnuibacter physcomitrellae]
MSRSADALRCVVIRHEQKVALGNIAPVLVEHGYTIEYADADSPDFAESLSRARDVDLVVVLGSERAVYEEHAFLSPELAFLRSRLAAEQATFGVCFGAQVIAEALGGDGTVRRGPAPDVGFRAIEPTPAGLASPVRHVVDVPMAEWHGDTFALPDGVTLLASSSAYAHEAYGIGSWLLAVQFHPELTAPMHEEWVATGREYLESAGLDEAALRAEAAKRLDAQQRASRALVTEYLEGLPSAR